LSCGAKVWIETESEVVTIWNGIRNSITHRRLDL
jgi:hypothetical protein